MVIARNINHLYSTIKGHPVYDNLSENKSNLSFVKKNRNIVDLKHTNFTLKCLPGVRIMSKLRTFVFMYAERKLT